jgi:predicted lipoprotein with Yx(FWY)xxD motif
MSTATAPSFRNAGTRAGGQRGRNGLPVQPGYVIAVGDFKSMDNERIRMRKIWAAAGLAAVALAVSACGNSSSSSPAASTPAAGASSPAASAPASSASANTVLSTTINGTQVLTNSKGFTLYWFAPDTSTTSKCTGSCATYWPPVTGPVTAGSGVTGMLGTITRPDGTTQATYDGHPLYTYAGDTAPGQAKGNRLNASGGLWYEMTASGVIPATSTSGGGGGY